MHTASLSNIENVAIDDLKLTVVNNCLITRSQLLLTVYGVHNSCLFENLPTRLRFKLNLVALGSALKNKLKRLRSDEEYFFLMNTWATGYHHWLAEVAPKFFLFEEELKKGQLLMPKNRPRFITEFLQLFEFTNVVDVEENAFAKKLNVITNPNSGHFNPAHIFLLRDKVTGRLGIEFSKAERKLYVSRSRAAFRKVVNEKEVSSYLESKGFESVILEDLSFAEQVRLFADVRSLVSIHGAGLTNAIFMQPGGNVVELYPQFEDAETELNACYKRLSTVLGHNHVFIFSERERKGRRPNLHIDDIRVDIGTLETWFPKL